MSLFRKHGKKIVLLLVLLVVLTGCAKTTGADGKTLPEKIIYTTTTFKDVITNESWITALLVYPMAWLINILAEKTGVILAIILTTLIVNIILLPVTIKSTASQQKIQMLQPEIERITKRYEGRDDDYAKQQQAAELQAVYQKHGVNPLASLGTTITTLPLLISMYQAVIRAEAVCNGTFMGYDLQLTIKEGVQTGGKIQTIAIIIFVLMALSQYLSMNIPVWLAKRQAVKERIRNYDRTTEDDTRKLTNVTMLVMVCLLAISMPTAMSVYWIVSSMANVLKTFLIQVLVVNKG